MISYATQPGNVAVDGSGNVYIAKGLGLIQELPRAFVPAGPIGETAAGADTEGERP